MGRRKAIPIKFVSQDPVSPQNLKRLKTSPSKNFPSHLILPPDDSNIKNYLGDIWLGNSNNILPETWEKCKVSFITTDESLYLKMHFDATTTVLIKVTNDYKLAKGLFTSKIFAMQFQNKNDSVIAELYIVKFPLPRFNTTISSMLQMVFATIFNIVHDTEVKIRHKKLDVEEVNNFYKNISIIRNQNLQLPQYNQHPFLKPELRDYQKNAVCWMKMREQQSNTFEMLHPLYQIINLKSEKIVYYSKYLGHIEEVKPLANNFSTGGILADEMGLGKTVEVLACILSHPMSTTEIQNSVAKETVKTPTINKQPRKRERDSSSSTLVDSYVAKPKKLKIPDDWVKGSSKKSSTRVALEMWYESTLGKVSTTTPSKPSKNQVQCICGDLDIDGTIMCTTCFKSQHAACMDYTSDCGDYICPKCWTQQPLLESKATLIICPISLQTQWCEEICKHVSTGMNILVYEGSKAVPIYPTKLKDYDLVLTTYNILQSQLRLSESGQALTLRREQRYSSPGCPLVLIKWWRLCIDEAQTVEIPTAMISVMAKKLHACHRWAVTGTPISRDLSGLYGLIDYLLFEPYNDQDTWNHLLYYPYLLGNKEPMHKFLAQIMWRSTKDDVINQINIPKQTINEYTIEFSAVEKYYYQREHELCTNSFLDKLRGYDCNILLNTIDKRGLKKLMTPLLSIRQACNHPNAARGRYLGTNKHVTSMEGLLDALIEKNITDSEETLRIVVSALNGLAGIYLLLQHPMEAVEKYREVMQLAARFTTEDNKKGLTFDKLQLIHTMYNLAEIIEINPEVPPTLRDDTLRQECLTLQEKYIGKYIAQNIQAYNETKTAIKSVSNLQETFILEPGQWYDELIHWVIQSNLDDDLNSRIDTVLDNASSKKYSVSSGQNLLYCLATWDQDLENVRQNTIKLLDKMYTYKPESECKLQISEQLVNDAMECHLRPEKKSKKHKKCLVCNLSVQMRKHESVLFNMEKKSEEDISNQGSWKPTSQELVLKALYNLARVKGAEEDLLKDGELYFRILESEKKEFKQMRKFWTHLDQQICAHDEINMCKIRLSLKEGSHQDNNKSSTSRTDKILKQLLPVLENKLQYINFVEEHELNYQASVLQNEERQNMIVLERNLGIYSYLETLRLQQYAGQSPDPCPICKNALQDHWSILPCGHCYCLECIQILFEKTNANRISCSVCRQLQKVEEVSYIRTGEVESKNDVIKIRGNYSTKIEAVVKLIIKLRNENENVKILVFSTWVEILKIMGKALVANNVATELMLQNSLQQSLTQFKNNSATTLLLPIHLGSKGLNLIEATHLILVEPLLNPGDELQAIGRIHRIGQTKPTTVHKFIVKNTIEESLHIATTQNANSWDKSKITLQQLRNLFIETFDDQQSVHDPENVSEINNVDDDSIRSIEDTHSVTENINTDCDETVPESSCDTSNF